MWWAGSAAPARFLVSILPLAVLPIAVVGSGALENARRAAAARQRLAGRARARSSRAAGSSSTAAAPLDATLEWLSQIVDLPLALPSVHRDGGSIAIRDGAVWLAACSLARRRDAGCSSGRPRWTGRIASVALAVAAMIATTVVVELSSRFAGDARSFEARRAGALPAGVAATPANSSSRRDSSISNCRPADPARSCSCGRLRNHAGQRRGRFCRQK